MIFSILLQHHTSKLFRYFWSTFRSAKVSPPHKAIFQISTLLVASLFKSNSLVKRSCFLLNTALAMEILDLINCIIGYLSTQILEIFHILQLFLIYHNFHRGWLHWDFHYLYFFIVIFSSPSIFRSNICRIFMETSMGFLWKLIGLSWKSLR